LTTVWVVAVVPSPRLQDRLATPVDLSVRVTTNGAAPVIGLAAKLAIGAEDAGGGAGGGEDAGTTALTSLEKLLVVALL
jgi:hypothetical protein